MKNLMTALSALMLLAACGSDGPTDVTDATSSPDTEAAPEDTAPGADTASPADTEADATEPACPYTGTYLIPGPCEAGHDAELALKARRYERTWVTFHAAAHGASVDLGVSDPADRALIDSFVNDDDGWDFEAFSGGRTALEIVGTGGKVAGLYAGMGIAASAYRYGVLRDQGYPLEEVELARDHMLMGLQVFDQAVTMPNVTGVIARNIEPKTDGSHTTPLFDGEGNPLPEIKNNGTWREDESGLYPDYMWEDSCSRDYMLGWVTAAGAIWEVIRGDDTVSAEVKAMLQGHAKDLGDALMTVRTDPAFCQGLSGCENGLGHDLQIPDADGRRTLHGCLHEHDFDCNGVLEFMDNGFNAVMALGFVATWAFVSEDPELVAYVDSLINERDLHTMTRDSLDLVAMGAGANWSGWNMAFGGIWLAQRYVTDVDARAALRTAVKGSLYDIEGGSYLPVEVGQSYFDFIYAAGDADLGAGLAPGSPGLPTEGREQDGGDHNPVDQAAMDRGLDTLRGFSQPPYWDVAMVNCPDSVCECATEDCPSSEKAVAVTECVAPDGTEFTVVGCYGWKGTLIAEEPVPMAIRPASNYHWRSNPYKPNGGGVHGEVGGQMFPAVDFRIAYWLGRWAKVSE